MALRGAIGFLTRLPVGTDERAWQAFVHRPVSFPLAGYLVGGIVALAVAPSLPPHVTAVVLPAWLYLLTGVTHLDGLGDVGDAMAVHGGPDDRRQVMHDPAVGAGGGLAISLVVVGLAAAGLGLAVLPIGRAVTVVIAAEVGAKAGMATLICLGTAAHDGMGSTVTARARPRALVGVAVAALPAAFLTWPAIAGGAALFGGVVAALGVGVWANRRLGGVSGDVLGAANEVGRVVGLHLGVLVWMH